MSDGMDVRGLPPSASTSMSASSFASDASSDYGQESASSRHAERATLVWCHEHCHKAKGASLRDHLAQAAKSVGGRLYCLKKAAGFQRWAQEAKPRCFLLLVDWREAKPCGDFLLQHFGEMPQHALAVYTESAKQYRLATQSGWSTGLAARGYTRPVFVLPPCSSEKEFALRAAQMLQENDPDRLPCGSDAESSSPTGLEAPSTTATIFPSVWQPAVSQPATCMASHSALIQQMQEPDRKHGVLTYLSVAGMVQPTLTCVRPQWGDVGSCVPARHYDRAFVEMEGKTWAEPVAKLLGGLFPASTRAEVARFLTMAAPERYEE